MLWMPRLVPVCVFERVPRSIFRSDFRLVFLGRLNVSPVLFIGSGGYFAYLADQNRFRLTVLSELKRIMSSAGLDNTYHIEEWFMSKGRLLVRVAKKAHEGRRQSDLSRRKRESWRERLLNRFR